MCFSAIAGWLGANAATVGAVAGGLGAAAQIRQGVMAGKDARNAQQQAAQAEARASQSANARIAQRRRALKSQSLLTGGDAASSGMASAQRETMGGA